jgi:hypothetical protein
MLLSNLNVKKSILLLIASQSNEENIPLILIETLEHLDITLERNPL